MAETLREWWPRCRWKRQFLTQYAHRKKADTEAGSTFRLAGAGVQNYEKTIAGTEARLSMLGQKLTRQQRAMDQYSRALVAVKISSRKTVCSLRFRYFVPCGTAG